MAEHDPQRSQLERLSEEYASLLGAETSTERNVKRVVPWVLSLAIHVAIILLAMAVTWSVTNLPKKDESVLIVADFNALNYDPVAGFKAPQTPASDRPRQDHAQSTPTDQA